MLIAKPSYYDRFRCIAGDCPDTCCKEWSVQVDPDSAAAYRSLSGELGDLFRRYLIEEDGDTVIQDTDGKCPLLRADGLCRVQSELGEQSLCQVCRDFPRIRHEYGTFTELGLELSCPEAARMILAAPVVPLAESGTLGHDLCEYDTGAMALLTASRSRAIALLADKSRPVPHRLALLLLYGYQAQALLDGESVRDFDPDAALASAARFTCASSVSEFLDFFRELEILNPGWPDRLSHPEPGPWTEAFASLAAYFVHRYWLQAVSDYDLICRVKFGVISCLAIHFLGGDLPETACRYSREIENDADNVDALLDAACESPAFTDNRLLCWLLK